MKTFALSLVMVLVGALILPLSAVDVGRRIAMWDDGVENSAGHISIELPEQESRIPISWVNRYPTTLQMTSGDCSTVLRLPTGKIGHRGQLLYVWQDYVAGTDPTDTNSVFTATITIVDGAPVVEWSPKLSAAEEAQRRYTIYGRAGLESGEEWHSPTNALDRFFKVGVEMR